MSTLNKSSQFSWFFFSCGLLIRQHTRTPSILKSKLIRERRLIDVSKYVCFWFSKHCCKHIIFFIFISRAWRNAHCCCGFVHRSGWNDCHQQFFVASIADSLQSTLHYKEWRCTIAHVMGQPELTKRSCTLQTPENIYRLFARYAARQGEWEPTVCIHVPCGCVVGL